MKGKTEIQSKLENSLENLKKMVMRKIKQIKSLKKSGFKILKKLLKEDEERNDDVKNEKSLDYVLGIKEEVDVLVNDSFDFIKSLHSESEFLRRYKIIQEESRKVKSRKRAKRGKFRNQALKEIFFEGEKKKKKFENEKENFRKWNTDEGGNNCVVDISVNYLKPKFKVGFFLILKEWRIEKT